MAKFRRMTIIWGITILLLLPLLAWLGYFMRLFQAGVFPKVRPERFYNVLTLHSLGMIGTWFAGSMAGVSYLLLKYIRPSRVASRLSYWGTLLSFALLIACTLGGQFGTGWYFLYPLPLKSQKVWEPWAAFLFFVALTILVVCWMIWTLDILRSIGRRYSLGAALGLNYVFGGPGPEVPPLVLITTVSLIVAVAGFAAGLIVIALFGARALGVDVDPLLMKNLTFFFGNILVNITMYLGVGMVYELLPVYAGRPWKTTRTLAIAWAVVLLLIPFDYFHHLYMDFAQPTSIQRLGQIFSYALAIPAAVVSIFGTLALVYGARMRWTLASTLLFLGVMGWGIGGIAAVINSTVEVNSYFHNTLWVPAHFHTYYLMGVVLMILGFIDYAGKEISGLEETPLRSKLTVALLLIGGYGFLSMFYWAGAHSIPRRYASYPLELARGTLYARIAVGFITVLLLGILLYVWETGKRCFKALSA